MVFGVFGGAVVVSFPSSSPQTPQSVSWARLRRRNLSIISLYPQSHGFGSGGAVAHSSVCVPYFSITSSLASVQQGFNVFDECLCGILRRAIEPPVDNCIHDGDEREAVNARQFLVLVLPYTVHRKKASLIVHTSRPLSPIASLAIQDGAVGEGVVDRAVVYS